jgi:hypothetical protein
MKFVLGPPPNNGFNAYQTNVFLVIPTHKMPLVGLPQKWPLPFPHDPIPAMSYPFLPPTPFYVFPSFFLKKESGALSFIRREQKKYDYNIRVQHLNWNKLW